MLFKPSSLWDLIMTVWAETCGPPKANSTHSVIGDSGNRQPSAMGKVTAGLMMGQNQCWWADLACRPSAFSQTHCWLCHAFYFREGRAKGWKEELAICESFLFTKGEVKLVKKNLEWCLRPMWLGNEIKWREARVISWVCKTGAWCTVCALYLPKGRICEVHLFSLSAHRNDNKLSDMNKPSNTL